MTFKDVTCVINLPHRADRRRQMLKELSRVRWEAEFFPAVRPDDAGGFPSIGARGCFLSHMNVLKRARTAGVERLVILEDDLNFTDGFAEGWKAAIAELEAHEWSIFYPGHILKGLPAGLSLISPAMGVQCAHFMVINGTAIQILIDGLEAILSRPPGHPLGGPMHVDGAYFNDPKGDAIFGNLCAFTGPRLSAPIAHRCRKQEVV
jgi:glycosyl transferase family 25